MSSASAAGSRSLQVRCGPMQSRRVAASGSAAGPRSLEVDDEMAPSAAAAADEVLQHLFRLVDEEVAGERPGIEKSTVFN